MVSKFILFHFTRSGKCSEIFKGSPLLIQETVGNFYGDIVSKKEERNRTGKE